MPEKNTEAPPVYLPGLNGIRAIAAFGVLLSHFIIRLPQAGRWLGTDADGLPRGLLLAPFGVSMFFSLSGFLITYLLLEERRRTGRIHIGHFYIRRILRIWPLYYTVLLVSIWAEYQESGSLDGTAVGLYIGLLPNLGYVSNHILGFAYQYWSVGMEEQFYLVWPWLVSRAEKRLLSLALALLAGWLLLKAIAWGLGHFYGKGHLYTLMSILRFDLFLIGCIGGILYFLKNDTFLRFSTQRLTQLAVWAGLLLLIVNAFHVASVIDHELVGVLTVLLIMGQVARRGLFSLENPVLDYLGKISYGLYLWHPLLIEPWLRLQKTLPAGLLLGAYTASVVGVAAVSYHFLEKPFLTLRRRYTALPTQTTASKTDN